MCVTTILKLRNKVIVEIYQSYTYVMKIVCVFVLVVSPEGPWQVVARETYREYFSSRITLVR